MAFGKYLLGILLVTACASIAIATGKTVDNNDDCEVTIPNGRIIGKTIETLNPEKNVCAYEGVPYAAPPVGELRFKAPVPAQSWDTLNATKQPNWCPQDDKPPAGIDWSEDCLYLNVYQPKNSNSNNNESLLPVMIYFHGGGFTGGSASEYTPVRLLARGDVILVVVQYRLGILGFLSTGDEVAPGNWGLKDQAYSIKWINENIANFGGNPGQVTIFGQSAGGLSASLQMLSPLNKGLIHGVIAQSGVSLATWAYDRNPSESAKVMARRLSCPTLTSHTIVNCFKNLTWQEMVNAQGLYYFESFKNLSYPYAAMSPVVEPRSEEAFITEEPLEIVKNGEVPNIPVMLGATKHDASFILANIYLIKVGPEKLDESPEWMRNELIPSLLKLFLNEEDKANRAVSSTVEMAYLNGVNRASWNESMPGLVDLLTVTSYKSSIKNLAELLSKRGLPIYVYSFEHHSENHLLWDRIYNSTGYPPVEAGIAHADELLYLFDFPSTFSPRDQTFSDLFVDMWLNFGTFGEPTPDERSVLKWPAYNGHEQQFLKLNNTPTVLSDYYSSWRPKGFEWN